MTLLPKLRRTRPWGFVGAALLGLGACGALVYALRGPRVEETGAPLLPRYWLVDTDLYDPPREELQVHIVGPSLVEVDPTGLVRGELNGKRFSGYLPLSAAEAPKGGGGLYLYAQRKAKIWYDTSGSAEQVGWVHPGAFVRLATIEKGARVKIGKGPFPWVSVPLFVDRGALGVNPRSVERPEPPKTTLARRVGGSIGVWQGEAAWTALNCWDLWFHGPREVSQFARGFELFGRVDMRFFGYERLRDYNFNACPAHVVVGQKDALTLVGPSLRGGEARAPLGAIPPGYRDYRKEDPDPLARAIEGGQHIYWIVSTQQGPLCDEWRFIPSARSSDDALEGTLRRRQPVTHSDQPEMRSVMTSPFDYRRATGHHPANLHLGNVEIDGNQALRCDCIRDYKLLGVQGAELRMLGDPLPGETPTRGSQPARLIAYDPGDTERWFLNSAACEAARLNLEKRLQSDGINASRWGTHSAELFGGMFPTAN